MPSNSTIASKISTALFCILTGLICQGNEARLTGTASAFKGYDIGVYLPADPITHEPEILDTDVIGQDGSFSLNIPVNSTRHAWLYIRRHEAPIYLKPGAAYYITITEENEAALVRTWQKGELQYKLSASSQGEMDKQDINVQIAQIDDAYFRFFSQNAALLGRKGFRSAVENWAVDLNSSFPEKDYTGQYLRYTIAEMKLVGGFPKKEVYEQSFQSDSIQMANPAWWSAFNAIYGDYFSQFNNRFGGSEIYNLVASGIGLSALDSLLRKDDFMEVDAIRHLVLLKELHDAAYDRRYSRSSVVGLIKTMVLDANFEHKDLSHRILNKLNGSVDGLNVHQLELDQPLPCSEKPLLLFITAAWSTTAEKEALLLTSLYESYSEVFEVAEVVIEGEKKSRPWTVAQPLNTEAFMAQLEVFRIPKCVWIGSDGKVEDLNAPLPSEEFERRLYKLQTLLRENQQIKIGQEAPR